MIHVNLRFILIQAAILLLMFMFYAFPARAAPLAQNEDPKTKADALYQEGNTLLAQGEYQTALDRYEQAFAIYQEIGDRVGVAKTLNGAGLVYLSVGQYSQALDYFQRALTIRQQTGDRSGEGSTLNNIGAVYKNVAQYPQALDYFQRALKILQETGDKNAEGRTINNIGQVYDSWGQYPQALEYYQRALAISREVADQVAEGTNLNNIGAVYANLGQYSQALEYYQQALPIRQKAGDQQGEGATLNNIGIVYYNRGQFLEALDYYQQGLTISKKINEQEGEEASLTNIGAVYDSLGQYSQALSYYQQALAISQQIGDRVGEGANLNNMGDDYRILEQYQQAIQSFQQGLEIAQEIGYKAGEGTALSNIGLVYDNLGQFPEALDYYQQGLTISQAIGDRAGEAAALDSIGQAYSSLKKYSQALDYYQQALAIRKDIGDKTGEARTLSNMGWLSEQQNDNAQAIDLYQQATSISESIQGEIKVEELKASFAAQHANTYEHLISLLWNDGHFEEAFNFAERARARAFLDQLAGGHLDFRSGVDAALLGSERSLRDEINSLQARLIAVRNRPANELDTQAIAALQEQLQSRETDYTQLLTEIKLQSPEIAGYVSVDVASLADIQGLLNSQTTLVEYFVTGDRVLAFIITQNTFDTFASKVGRDDLTSTITNFRDFANLDDPFPASLRQLYTWLIAPLKDKLQTPTVGIIPHGTLHYLPFAALSDGKQYFGEEHSLFTLPSASALRFIQEKDKPLTNKILAIGNPTTTEPGLVPLDYAQQEVETISGLFGTQPLIGDAATEGAFRSQAGSASIIHLAAHGQYDPANSLFSAIYLAQDRQDDGRLEVHEIYGLDLTRAADMVVLSACQTNVGALSAGDEVVGLTRAFLFAGAPTVIASLWNVDDKATTLLMERFYTHLRAGMGKAQALQQAQRDVRAQYPHPYYWASFVLTGSAGTSVEVQATPPNATTTPMQRPNMSGVLLLGLCSLGFLAALLGGIAYRRRKKVGL